MKIIFLGTTGYHPNERRHTSCIMLPELGIVFDAGTGFFRVRNHLCTTDLNVFLSHAHLDHSIGLTFIFDVLHEKNVRQVVVHGEHAKLKALEENLLSPLLFPVKPPFSFRPFDSNQTQLPDGTMVEHFPLEHPGGSVGFRVESNNSSFAYVTDSTANQNADYIHKIKDVDLLIHECYFPDGHEARAALTGHSTTSEVAQVAAKANAKRLVLVHVNPLDESDDPIGIDRAKSIFANTEIANDNQVIELP